MSEIIKKRVKNSIGKIAKIFLINGFRYEGKIIDSDEKHVEILDFKTDSFKIILIAEINDMEIKK